MTQNKIQEAYQAFRQSHPEKYKTIQGMRWSYLDCGRTDGVPLLWLVGGLKVADAAFEYIPLLEDSFRIIAPSYPAIDKMDTLVDQLADLLSSLGIEKVHLLAGSFGGMIAQVFIRRHPEMVEKCILSTTSAPDAQRGETYQKEYRNLKYVPAALVKRGGRDRFLKLVHTEGDRGEFMRWYLHELFVKRFDKADIRSTLGCVADYMGKDFKPDDLGAKQADLLIIYSQDDMTFGKDNNQAMMGLYPEAKSYIFEKAGHSPASVHQEDYFKLVRNFLHET